MGMMKTAVFYLSRTGNTKRFAETISESLKVPLFDVTTFQPASATDYDLLIIGTPVTGGKAAPEVFSFVQKLPEGVNKKRCFSARMYLPKVPRSKTLSKNFQKKATRLS